MSLTIRNLHVAFRRNLVLDDVSLDVAPGETLVLFGPSGVGKTVLLRAIAGVEPAARGQVLIDGRDVSALGPDRRDLGMAFQNFALYPHLAARENIASPLRARGVASAEIEARVKRVAELLRISHVLDHPPRALSNGQKQRTALARALVGQPRVLLLDDPLRNVDAKLRYEMRLELPRLLRAAEAATIYVTQDYREAMALGDRIAVLHRAAIAQCDIPEAVYDAPVSVNVARLFGDPPLNLLPCRPVAEAGGLRVEAVGLRLLLPAAREAAGRDCLLGLRPETITVSRAAGGGAGTVRPAGAGGAGVPVEIVAATPLHERMVLLLRAAGGVELLASVLGEPPQGVPVVLQADEQRALLFDAESGARIPHVARTLEVVA